MTAGLASSFKDAPLLECALSRGSQVSQEGEQEKEGGEKGSPEQETVPPGTSSPGRMVNYEKSSLLIITTLKLCFCLNF